METVRPRAFRIRPTLAAVMPLPREEVTPPVTKTYFAMGQVLRGFFQCYRKPRPASNRRVVVAHWNMTGDDANAKVPRAGRRRSDGIDQVPIVPRARSTGSSRRSRSEFVTP